MGANFKKQVVLLPQVGAPSAQPSHALPHAYCYMFAIRPTALVSPRLSSNFVYPEAHLGIGNYPQLYHGEPSGIPSDWAWATSDPHVRVKLTPGIPILHHMTKSSSGSNFIIISVCIDY